ncbi:MAG: hypothetical protein DRI87_06600, partial [Bacteroidetes bacterium]
AAPMAPPVGVDLDVPTVYRSYVKANGGEWGASAYNDFMMRAVVSGPGDNVQALAPEQMIYPAKLSPELYVASTRAFGVPGLQGAGTFSPVIVEHADRDLASYQLYRIDGFDPDAGETPADGTHTLIEPALSGQQHNDTDFGALDPGFYAYGVIAEYDNGDESDITYSNIVAHLLDNVVTINVTQCDDLSPEGAFVELTGQNFPYQILTGVTDATGVIVFDSVIDGTYDLVVTKEGYMPYVHNNIWIYDDLTIDVVLQELMMPARNLYVEPLTSVATWESPYFVYMENEGFDAGTDFPPAGWTSETNGEGWFHTDNGSSSFFYIPPGDGWYACSNDDANSGNDGCCDYLILPEMDLSEAIGFMVQFDAYFTGAYGQMATVEYSLDGGSSWAVAASIPTSTAWETYQLEIDDLAGEASVLLAFHSNDGGAWASGVAVDNVAAYYGKEPVGYYVYLDGGFVAETAGDVMTYQYQNLTYGQAYTAEVRALYSCGVSDPIFYTFTSGYLYPPRNLMDEYVYNTNEVPLFWNPPMTVAGPAPSFSNIDDGEVVGTTNHSIKAAPASEYSGGSTPGTIEFSGFRDGHTAYFMNTTNDEFYSMDMSDYSYSLIGSTVIDASAGDFMNNETDVWYTTGNWGADLYSVDVATGTGTFIASTSGVGSMSVTGMACDRTTNTMYVCFTDISQSGIGTIDLETGVITQIGTQTDAPGMIEIAIDGTGQMYAWDIVTDMSYTVDKTTGAVTTLGSLGIDLNYGQGGNWDSEDDVIYMTAYNLGAGGSEFRALDVTTGGTTYLGSLPTSQNTAFGVPGGGGSGGGVVPDGLLSFNLYRDDALIANVPYNGEGTEDWVMYVDNNLIPMCYTYDVTALYDLSVFGFPGEIGESAKEGPHDVCIIYGMDIPFCEDWAQGTFEFNGWTPSGDNWEITNAIGNDAPSAQWNWDPDPGVDYSSTLTSAPFNADMLTEGRIWLDFDLALQDRNTTGDEMMKVEVFNGLGWSTVATFDNAEGSFDFTANHIEITGYAMSGVFQVRFNATGVNSFDVINWNVDNICVYRTCDAPFNLTGEYVWNASDDFGAEICWEANVASAASQWFYYDDESIEYVWGSTGDWDADVAIKVEAADLADFEGAAVTQYRAFVDGRLMGVGTVSVKVYQGDNPDPSTPIYVEDVTDQFVNADDWNDFIFSTPVMIDHTQPLWIGMYYTGPADTYGPGITLDMGTYDPNGDLYWESGAWHNLTEVGINNRAWLLRGYVTTEYGATIPIGNDNIEVMPVTGLNTAGTLASTEATPSVGQMSSTRELNHFNVYRSPTDMGEYTLIGSIGAEAGVAEYCYYDLILEAQTTYCYKVTAVYTSESDECESDYALDVDEVNDYVCVLITDIDDPLAASTVVYPNPARDQVTISSSQEMTRIMVLNYVGQLVLDSEVNQSKVVLNTSDYESGIYLVRIETENGVVTKRFA